MRRHPLVLVASCVLLLTGCGDAAKDGDAARPPAAAASVPGKANDTDVMFLQMMATHHAEGLEMVRLAKQRATRSDVKTLAAAIDTTETAEVDTMTGWLRAWGKPTAADPNASVHASHAGMVSTGPVRIASLRQATDADFDQTFINLLIGHQHNAVELARMETAGGAYPEAKDLAKRIDESRTAQISMMLRMLG